MSNSPHPAGISGLSEIAGNYDYILSDVWGVVHNGVRAHRAAVDALARFRENGGVVILITNAPRPKSSVVEQLDGLGVDRAAYDDIVTSGDVARSYLVRQPQAKIFHLGPDRDRTIYTGLPNALVDETGATLISCSGLFDDNRETPDDYTEQLRRLAARGVPMLCANPDKVVERGDRLVWCAGALAERYADFGGETIILGKPYAPIYEAVFDRLEEIVGKPVDKRAVLAIGDGAATDLRGAFKQAIDILFVTDGIHAMEFGPRDAPDPDSVHSFLATGQLGAQNFTNRLTW